MPTWFMSVQTAGEKSSVTLESVAALSSVLVSTCNKYGDTSSSGWGLQDFLNSSRMGKDHFDRDQLVSDCYFAILYAQDVRHEAQSHPSMPSVTRCCRL